MWYPAVVIVWLCPSHEAECVIEFIRVLMCPLGPCYGPAAWWLPCCVYGLNYVGVGVLLDPGAAPYLGVAGVAGGEEVSRVSGFWLLYTGRPTNLMATVYYINDGLSSLWFNLCPAVSEVGCVPPHTRTYVTLRTWHTLVQ